MDKTELQQALSGLKPLEEQQQELEQYQTPPDIAADVLHRMLMNGELEGRVLDLGCGNGVFAVGAALLGADAVGVDVDGRAIETARENLENVQEQFGVEVSAEFVERDARDLDMEADAAVTNPPFGLQRRDMNRAFLGSAFGDAPVVYALLHRSRDKPGETREFIEGFASDNGFETDILTTYDFPLPRQFDHHEREKKYIKVDLYRFEQV
jgi:putative methylase